MLRRCRIVSAPTEEGPVSDVDLMRLCALTYTKGWQSMLPCVTALDAAAFNSMIGSLLCNFTCSIGATPTDYKLLKDLSPASGGLGAYLLQKGKSNTYILLFRGTKSLNNWLSDLTISLVPVPRWGNNTAYKGIYDLYMTGYTHIMAALKTVPLDANLYVTGHSLGGGLALLGGLDVALDRKSPNVRVIAFGCPQVVSPELLKWVQAQPTTVRCKEVVNGCDPVGMAGYSALCPQESGGATSWLPISVSCHANYDGVDATMSALCGNLEFDWHSSCNK